MLNGGGCLVRGAPQQVVFSACQFSGNAAGDDSNPAVGGGCSIFDAVVTFEDAVFDSNMATHSGGGLFVESQQSVAEVTLDSSSLRSNVSEGTGSAAQLQGDAASLEFIGNEGAASLVDDNSAAFGGAVNAVGNAVLSMSGMTFCSNVETSSGAVVHVTASQPADFGSDNCFSLSCQDANGDGRPDACCPEDWDGIPPACAVACGADLDGSGAVDINDLLAMLGAWGQTCPEGCPADLTGDGAVGIDDVLSLIAAFGPCV
jgi:hypothetical protein